MADAVIEFGTAINNTGFNKDLEKTGSGLGKLKQTLFNVSSAVDNAFGGRQQSKIDSFNKKLAKQNEAINKQTIDMVQLNEQYRKLMSGETIPRSFITMEKEVIKNQKEAAKLDAQIASLKEKLAVSTEFNLPGIQEQQNELNELLSQLSLLDTRSDQLQQTMESIKLDPSISEEAKKLASQISLGSEKLIRLNDDAEITEKQLNEVFETKPDGLKNDVKTVNNEIKKTTGNIDNSSSALERFIKRINRLVLAAFVFNVIRRGLSLLTDYLGRLLKTNAQFVYSINQIKVALSTAFQPIFEAILPAINFFAAGIAKATTYVASFISMIFGKTLDQSKQAAQSINQQAESLNAVKNAANGARKSIASFDKINQQAQENAANVNEDTFSESFDVKLPEVDTTIWDKFLNLLQPTIDAINRLNIAMEPFKQFVWRGILDFYNLVLKPIGKWVLGIGLPRFIDGIAFLMKNVNWSYLNDAMEGFWRIVSEFGLIIGEGLLWFYENVLIPLGIWAINDVAPAAINLITAALNALKIIIEAAKPGFIWLFENLLKPLAAWTGGIIVDVIKWLTQRLTDFSNWARQNQANMDLISKTVLGFLAGIWIYNTTKNLISFMGSLINWFRTFGDSAFAMGIKAALPAIAIGVLAAAIIYVASVWDKLNGAQRAITILGALAAAAIAAAIAIAVFHTSWSIGIAAAVIVGGIAAIVIAFNSLKGSAAELGNMAVPDIFSMSSSVDPTTIDFSRFNSNPLPRLAQGGIVPPNNPRAVIVGDNTREDEIISPRSAIREEVMNAIEELGGIGGGNQNFTIEATGTMSQLIRLLRLELKKENTRAGERIKNRTVNA